MLKRKLKKDNEIKLKINDKERTKVNACLVKQVLLFIMIILRSRSILKRKLHFKKFLERHVIKKIELMCKR